MAEHEVRLTPKPEKASEDVDGLRSPLGVAATRATHVAQPGRPIGFEASLQVVAPFPVRAARPGVGLPARPPEAAVVATPHAAPQATYGARPATASAYFSFSRQLKQPRAKLLDLNLVVLLN